MNRQLHLNLFVFGRGHHEGAWRHPLAPSTSLTDVEHYQALAAMAEKGLLDSLFLADVLAVGDTQGHSPITPLEPITLLAALSATTRHIGLIGTASTTYMEPFNLARQFAALDHLSRGRIGWNIVTSWVNGVEANFGHDHQPPHAERYARAFEFMEVVKGLWDTWADDAVLDDRSAGQYLQPERIAALNHRGAHFQVRGPLNIPASPQRHPVLFQAGSSADGQRFAAQYAEAVFTAQPDLPTAQAFYRSLKQQVHEVGRQPHELLVLPGLSAVVAESDQQAGQLLEELNALTALETGLARLSARFGGHDFSRLPLDLPLSVDDLPNPDGVQAAQSRARVVVELVRSQRPTLRQLLTRLAGARGHYTLAGTPEQIADAMQTWFQNGAADGFNLMPPIMPAMLATFIDEVIPLLQQRGLFRTAYQQHTLRQRYGLARPASRFFG
ncbi:LLM class flavin-dependent oxidoreductase [Pseudomonas eucalypticola]|uniref:LLM class flavin-dependent oxidoreductase n=1 Tax=Pseudomonas eucalypticola TaxID=2599595 RepID=A0A7D5HQ07_9PSED|nr:LLM class flavin-dependent oxidoreductase [Pseudomonas eucalypticola]QKZ05688.1 LLM class flavin-dependent oxidoreductase [Pseudomonas eucalypticola]